MTRNGIQIILLFKHFYSETALFNKVLPKHHIYYALPVSQTPYFISITCLYGKCLQSNMYDVFCVLSELVSISKEKCECIEPCNRKVYQTQLSYASISGLSVSQILTSDLEKLDRNNRVALETRKRTQPKMFVSELAQMSRMSISYSKLLSTVKDKAWNKDRSIFKKVDKALCLLISSVMTGDIQNSTIKSTEEYINVFEAAYGRVRNTIGWHLEMLPVEIDLFLRALDSSLTLKNGSLHINDHIQRLISMLDNLGESINTYYHASKDSASIFISPELKFFGNQTDRLPEILNVKSDECEEMIRHFTETTIVETKTLLNNITNQDQQTTTKMDIRYVFDTLLKFENNMKDVSNCLDEYLDFLYRTREDNTQVLKTLEKDTSDLILCPSSATVDDILDYIDESRNVREIADKIEVITAKIAKEDTNSLIAETFNEDSILELEVELESFVSRIETRLLGPSRERITNLKKDAVNLYLQLLQSEHFLSR